MRQWRAVLVTLFLYHKLVEATDTGSVFGNLLRFLSLEGEKYPRIEELAEDEYHEGHILVATLHLIVTIDSNSKRIHKIVGNSSYKIYKEGRGSEASFGWITGIAQVRANEVYVTDTIAGCIRKVYRDSNTTEHVFGSRCSGEDNMSSNIVPVGMAYNPYSNHYFIINNSKVVRFYENRVTGIVNEIPERFYSSMSFDRSSKRLYLVSDRSVLIQLDYNRKSFAILTQTKQMNVDSMINVDKALMLNATTAVYIDRLSNQLGAVRIPSQNKFLSIDIKTVEQPSSMLLIHDDRQSHLLLGTATGQIFRLEIHGKRMSIITTSTTPTTEPDFISPILFIILMSLGLVILLILFLIIWRKWKNFSLKNHMKSNIHILSSNHSTVKAGHAGSMTPINNFLKDNQRSRQGMVTPIEGNKLVAHSWVHRVPYVPSDDDTAPSNSPSQPTYYTSVNIPKSSPATVITNSSRPIGVTKSTLDIVAAI